MLDRTIYINGYSLHITQDTYRNTFIGTIKINLKYTFYGDSVNDVIKQAEEFVNDMEDNLK